MNRNFNVVITGIGGQGVITTGAIIAHAAVAAGHDVRSSELHGLSLRFGPLQMHVRFGKKVNDPMVPAGKADLIIGLERLETLRALEFAGPRTAVMFDPRAAVPTQMSIRKQKYPSEPETVRAIRKFTKGKIVPVTATEKAKAFGADPVAANVYLLGRALALRMLPLKREHILVGMRDFVPPKALEQNKKLFDAGFEGL
jgi:indolepyruvate ferredoxin oxidoreductase beta subunit